MIKLALIGCGGMSNTHARRFTQNANRMKVVAAVDIAPSKAQEAAKAIGAGHAVTDYKQILPEVDAALLALPHHLHHEIGMECLKAGKHVLMEKPLANTEKQCLDLIAESEKQGAVLMVAYCMRFHPLVVRLKELIDSKTYGDTFHVSIWTEQYTNPDNKPWINSAEKLGGGQFFSHGCHYIDILLELLGNPIEGTHTGTNFGTPWMEKEGTSDVSIKFESGAVGYHGGTWGARGTKLKYAIHVHGTKGMLEADISNGLLIEHKGAIEENKGSDKVLMEVGAGKHVEKEMAHFLDCIEKGHQPITDARSSLRGLQLIWKLYEAEQNKQVADLRGL